VQSRAFSDQGDKDPSVKSSDAEPEAPTADGSEQPETGSQPANGFQGRDGGFVQHPEWSAQKGDWHYRNVRPSQHQNYDRVTYPPRNVRNPRGVYKATLVGEVGQLPIQKILKSGRTVTIVSVGTGGMYNNRRPFEDESPQEFADRSYTQWHRVAVYQDKIAGLVMQHARIGAMVYLEGNIETRVYNDPNSGSVKRLKEIAVRNNGRLMFMNVGADVPTTVTTTRPPISTEAPSVPISEEDVKET